MSLITFDQLKEHTNKTNMWLLIDGKVYDVAGFLDEHPGGDEVILSEAGKDATEAFEDVGHSDEARAMLPNMLVGEFEKSTLAKSKTTTSSAAVNNAVEQSSNAMYFVPLAALAAYFAWRFYGA
ncbi:cytochrome b5 [Stereum hirsutum FP-91666 SS1]|uniref:cytochrome b5 n=1 Tax=Stereum hirsutum (strain FP-91666) TaxID=721885 RepID=UPI000440FD6C|nr:cytochrome b5 [Stereum hirsutum FP-91666 SS1]EIM88355.1 cytochrome b5 [Stereum hirsutum FP-91666 SS1]